ncbi:hypothetical protein PGT21_035855 [Puccinia graminis f. sp. tritici]|uniref:Uncharacterized protein n=1 Tax=Puccinia graminis f. sp. tritici TaxID=56615 RepID=A0A5B0N8T1_PUCGR|nr:hypothetical protein PGTUg99_028750 [Puccinia graminis f. sp. tritici]KAA1084834.1 hypothetical protein PGT21_035855 [Puccinia graminis f. sp. tritici]
MELHDNSWELISILCGSCVQETSDQDLIKHNPSNTLLAEVGIFKSECIRELRTGTWSTKPSELVTGFPQILPLSWQLFKARNSNTFRCLYIVFLNVTGKNKDAGC